MYTLLTTYSPLLSNLSVGVTLIALAAYTVLAITLILYDDNIATR